MRVAMMGAALVLAGALAGGTAAAPVTHAACAKGKVAKTVKGKRVCVAKPPARQKPPTRPKAPALAPSKRGHYSGATAQNAEISFDVAVVSGRVVLRGITVPELDETCDPGAGAIAFSVSFGAYALYPNAKGHVHASVSFDRGTAGRGTLVLDGTVSADGRASGTLLDTESLNTSGQTYACSTGTLAWTAGTGVDAVALAPRPETGHYHGTTAQGASIDFDVVSTSGVLFAQNLAIVEVDESCAPGQIPIALYNVSFGAVPMLVDGRGRLHVVFVDPNVRTLTVDAVLDASGHAFGTLVDRQVIEQGSASLACDSGVVSWNALRQ
jgi:hypothetical protein